ncbi:MAG: hexapeptide transferase [Alphaproteobacteria bacterium]|nr:hexapeptide transferase [Alphaproteobacteria bacterium]
MTRLPETLGKPHRRGCPRTLGSLVALLQADLYRYAGRIDARSFWRHFLFTPGYKYTVLMRSCGYLRTRRFQAFGLYPLSKWLLLRCRYKYGIAIPEYTVIGPGLFINRFGGIYVGGDAIIGANVNLTHGTMLGQANRGTRAGLPVVGNRVFIGAGAKVIGHIHLGDDCAIGANAVVTKDVPENGVVGGIPAKLISTEGSDGYINRLVPQWLMQRCVKAP